MSPFEKSTFTVLILLPVQMAVRRRPKALSRDVLQTPEVERNEIYMRNRSFNILKMERPKLCEGSKVDRHHMSGMTALAPNPSFPRKEDHGDNDTI